jgi:hypothetical protein
MTTNTITPKVIETDVVIGSPYNFNVPVASELEIFVEFLNELGEDVTADITYELLTSASVVSLLLDTSTVEILTWVGVGLFPVVNTLTIYRRTSDVQQTVYEFRADISVETAQEVDRLTRAQQDAFEKLDTLEAEIEGIESNINPDIDTDSLVDGSVTTPKIADLAVTTDKINNNSVTEVKLTTGSVTNTKLGANAVTAVKISNNAVTEDKILNGAITTNKISNNAVTEDKILNAAVTSAKLAQDVLDRFDQNIPFKFSVSTFNSNRLRIEAAEVTLNDSSKLSASTGSSLITFDGMEIDLISGNTYDLLGVLTGSNVFTLPIPSVGQYRTYLVQAEYEAVNSLGKTPLVLSIVGGQQAPILGNQVYPELGLNQELSIGYVTVQEAAGSLAPLLDSNMVTIDCNSNHEPYNNISRIRVVSHTFIVGQKLIPVYWNGTAWLAADGSDVTTLATHLILEVISNEEFTLAYSGRIFFPAHGLNIGAYYFLGEATGILDLVEADDFSNPVLQVETDEYFTLLGWRANEKSITNNIAGIDTILTDLLMSTPTIFVSSLAILKSIQVYDTVRKQLVKSEVEIRIDDINPNTFTLFSTSSWIDLRIDLIGVK